MSQGPVALIRSRRIPQHRDLFDSYFSFREHTEPPVTFHRWALIGCIAAWLGRSTWLPFGPSRIFPNQYIMLIGTPGTRKSTAIGQARSIIESCGYDTYAADKTSKEKFLVDLSLAAGESFDFNPRAGKGTKSADDLLDGITVLDVEDREPKEVFVVADEFNDFMGNSNIEFQSLLGRFWDWDNEDRPYEHRLKNSSAVRIYQPTVNILSGNTPQGFSNCFPLDAIGQGFMSRLILVHSEASGKKYSEPRIPDQAHKEELMAHFYEMRTKVQGPMKRTERAAHILDVIYHSWPELEDSRFAHYSTRRYTHLLKLCLVMAASRLSTEIDEQDVIKANSILAYTEVNMSKAIGELGTSRASAASNKIMRYLYDTRIPRDVQDIYKVVRNDLERPSDLHTILQSLTLTDKIQLVTTLDGKHGYLPKRETMSRKVLFVNMDYLKGRELS